MGIDIDNHDDQGDPDANRKLALHVYAELARLGFACLLYESNGEGGFHVWVILSDPVHAEKLRRFGLWAVREHGRFGVPVVKEFPKNEGDTPWGNWLRLPGRHHKREVYPVVWNGSAWVKDNRGKHILSLSGSDPALIG